MTTQQLDLTKKDQDLLRTFRTLLRMDNRQEFSSDNFRMYGLDRFLRDKQHGIGGLFAKWKHNQLIQQTGWTRSQIEANHMRRIATYKLKEPL